MTHCCAEYCTDEIGAENKGRRVPHRRKAQFETWLVRLGRLKQRSTREKQKPEYTKLLDTEFKKKLFICDKHIREEYFKQNKTNKTLLPNAVPMTRAQYELHVASLREEDDDAQLATELEISILRDYVQNPGEPLLRSGLRNRESVHATYRNTPLTDAEKDRQIESLSKTVENSLSQLREKEQAFKKQKIDSDARIKTLREELELAQAKIEGHTKEVENLHSVQNRLLDEYVKRPSVAMLSHKYIMNGTTANLRYWTNFQNKGKYSRFVSSVKKHLGQLKPGARTKSFEDAMLMWFARVRHNEELHVIGHLFNINCDHTVGNLLRDMNYCLLAYFRHPARDPMNLMSAKIVDGLRLPCYKEDYADLYIIVDATEFFIETGGDKSVQKATYSEYKHHNTAKQLVAMSAAGHCVYASPLYPGHISDKDIARMCKEDLFDKLPKGSSVMGDRGFEIKDLLPEGVSYNNPPRLKSGGQFTQEQNTQTKLIAGVRIHIERVNRRAKIFRMLAQEVRLVNLHFFCIAVEVCFYLADIISAIVRR